MYLKNLDHEIKFRIPNDMYYRLINISIIRNISISELVRNIITQYLVLEVRDEHKKSD